ncbi:MAG: hypothetical protein V9E85_10165 [Candidatus Nanopelagicales bacterium]|jgi:hypothetical protein
MTVRRTIPALAVISGTLVAGLVAGPVAAAQAAPPPNKLLTSPSGLGLGKVKRIGPISSVECVTSLKCRDASYLRMAGEVVKSSFTSDVARYGGASAAKLVIPARIRLYKEVNGGSLLVRSVKHYNQGGYEILKIQTIDSGGTMQMLHNRLLIVRKGDRVIYQEAGRRKPQKASKTFKVLLSKAKESLAKDWSRLPVTSPRIYG